MLNIKSIKPSIKILGKNAGTATSWIYNQANLTYNEIDYLYNGGIGSYDVFTPRINVKSIKPQIWQ